MDSDVGKLFIGGVSWETTEEKLRDHFSSYGEITDAVIMKEKVTGRARGFGFVVFADPAVADKAVLEKHIIDGRTVDVKKAVPRDEQHHSSARGAHDRPVRTKKIFVGGLPATVTEEDFKNYFEQFGNITDAVVMYDPGTHRPRGFGFITFDAENAVDKVLQKTFHELNQKLVEVKPAVPKEFSVPGSRGGTGSGFGGGGGGGGGGGSGRGGYGQGYNYSQGNTYGGNQFPGPPAGRGGYPPYGSVGYGGAPYGSGGVYGPTMNGGYGVSGYPGGAGYPSGGGYGGGAGFGGYGSTPAAGYGNAGGYGTGSGAGGYSGVPPPASRSPWGSPSGMYPTGVNPSGYGASSGGMGGYGTGWGSGPNGGQTTSGTGAYGAGGGGYGYGGGDASYGSTGGGYGAQTGNYGPGPGNDPYGASGYQRPGPDSSGNVAGYGVGSNAPAEGYGVAGKQTQRGPEARFRPYPTHGPA